MRIALPKWLRRGVAATSARTYEEKIHAARKRVEAAVARGPFHTDWKSLETYQAPAWYQDAKFGIFIHWGVYSVPAYGTEWYPRNMYVPGEDVFKHHLATYGPQAQFGYKGFIPTFTAARFDANRWAELFQKSGAKYVVPVAEHHDGFPMYDCSFSDWSAVKMGPKRDILGELAPAIRERGMHFAASSHRAENWWFYNRGLTFDSDVSDLRFKGLYGEAKSEKSQPDQAHLEDWLARTTEIVDRYQPELIWFDWWIEEPAFEPYLQKFAAFYYNRGAEWNRGGVVINYKNKAFPDRAAVLDIERGQLGEIRPVFWQTDTSVSMDSWGYIENDRFKAAQAIVDQLVDIVSKNGALLLNIGPRADGTIPEQAEQILLNIGKWLEVNGEAIYSTRPWKIFGEGPTKIVEGSFKDTAVKRFTSEDIRFTSNGSTLYAIALAWPENGKLAIKSCGSGSGLLSGRVKSVQMLGLEAPLTWRQSVDALEVDLPQAKVGDYAVAFKIRAGA